MTISDMPVGNIGIFVSSGDLFIVVGDSYNRKYAILLNNQRIDDSGFVFADFNNLKCEDLGAFTVKAVPKTTYDLEVTIG